MCSYLLTNYLLFAMDNLLDIVSNQSSLNKVDAKKLGVFASNVPIWDYVKITKSESKNSLKKLRVICCFDIAVVFVKDLKMRFFHFFT